MKESLVRGFTDQLRRALVQAKTTGEVQVTTYPISRRDEFMEAVTRIQGEFPDTPWLRSWAWPEWRDGSTVSARIEVLESWAARVRKDGS